MTRQSQKSYFAMPGILLSIVISFGFLASLAAFIAAFSQHRFSEQLVVSEQGVVLQNAKGQIIGRSPRIGPRAQEIEPADLTQEPDVMESYDQQHRFTARQDAFAEILRSQKILSITVNESAHAIGLTPEKIMPFEFWLQMLVGFAGFVVSAWIWALQPKRLPNQLFGLVGVCLWLAATCAAIYSTRWLALPTDLFAPLSALNALGSIGFGIALICLFLIYPIRLVKNYLLILVSIPILGLYVLGQLNLLGEPANETPLLTAIEMLAILVLVVIQFIKSRGRPLDMAAIRWVGVSTLIGSGLFICMAIIPVLLDAEPLVNQSYAFAFFLIVHLGIAFGLKRQNLFESELWAITMFKAVSVGILLIAVDVALVALLGSLSGATVLTMLLILPFFYLPWRSMVQRWLFQATPIEDLLEEVAHVALIDNASDRSAKWQEILQQAFTPLVIETSLDGNSKGQLVEIEEQGVMLHIPTVAGCAPLSLRYKNKGTRLFQKRDRQVAARMIDFLSSLKRQQEAFADGVTSERGRISRDLHDDLSALLMSGLNSDNPDDLKSVLRSSLAEVRMIVSAEVGDTRLLADILADSRAEAADRLEASGIALNWPIVAASGILMPQPQKALTSILREMVTNVIKHSEATEMQVKTRLENGTIYIVASDNGKGASAGKRQGNGLNNIRVRLTVLGGNFDYGDLDPTGFRTSIALPVESQ
ncbi:MAG: hypothetical protein V7676_16555 [Parasphingorhabdus sp.]|uniref:sensor histidine kinase n=1 Tax=Parasphingorhabdus sp. TaxID=2709688 RepID=UPI003002E4EC